MLKRLPEATHRFAEGLKGVQPTTVIDNGPLGISDRASVLIDALHLLVRIKALLETTTNLERSAHGCIPAATPGAALFMWPEEIRWPVATFEGLLDGILGALVARGELR